MSLWCVKRRAPELEAVRDRVSPSHVVLRQEHHRDHRQRRQLEERQRAPPRVPAPLREHGALRRPRAAGRVDQAEQRIRPRCRDLGRHPPRSRAQRLHLRDHRDHEARPRRAGRRPRLRDQPRCASVPPAGPPGQALSDQIHRDDRTHRRAALRPPPPAAAARRCRTAPRPRTPRRWPPARASSSFASGADAAAVMARQLGDHMIHRREAD